jgi:hypothetical protein
MRARLIQTIIATMLLCACAGNPGPGDGRYVYNVEGLYAGRLMVEGEPFDGTVELRTGRGGRVRGSFVMRAPLEVEGSLEGNLVDDLLRVTLTYETEPRRAGTAACASLIEGILTVSPGGDVFEGPVTITDCGDALSGRMSFRRAGATPGIP